MSNMADKSVNQCVEISSSCHLVCYPHWCLKSHTVIKLGEDGGPAKFTETFIRDLVA